MTRRSSLVPIALSLVTLASQCQSLSLSASNPAQLVNAFPLDFSYLVWHHNQDGFVDVVNVSTIKARSSAPLNIPTQSVLQLYDAASLLMPRGRLPVCSAGGRIRTNSENVRLSMAKLEEAVHSREAEAVIANAVAQAQLNQDQMNEELDVWRNDPLRKEQRTFQEQTGQSLQQNGNYDDISDAAVQSIGMLIGFANAYAAKAQAHNAVSKKEAEALKGMLSNEKEEVARIETTYEIALSEMKAFQQFVSSTTTVLSSLYTTDELRTPVHPDSSVERVCGTTASALDYVKFQAAPSKSDVVIARILFDRGGTQPTYFRRVNDTLTWVAPIIWPLDASSATVQIQDPNTKQWAGLSGSVNPGRPSVTAQVKEAKSTMSKLSKLYHNASFSGEGGDGHRTVFLP
jgi:hypothetical protein